MLSNTESQLISQLQAIVSKAGTAREYMTPDELAEYLHVSKAWVYNHIGEIPHIKKFGKVIFDREDIDRWLARDKVATAKEIGMTAEKLLQTRKYSTSDIKIR